MGLRIIPVGGLGEIGRNMTLFESERSIIAIDAGLQFPTVEMYGIDFVIPDFNYLRSNRIKFKGLIVTHGHEDHIGAISYLVKEFPSITIFGTKLTLELIKARITEKRNFVNQSNLPKMVEIHPDRFYNCDDFEFMPFRVNHSIADAVGIAIKTDLGYIVHTGDFKIDNTPVDNKIFDYHTLSDLGRKGVLLLMSDSTNSERKGFSNSEKEVVENLDYYFTKAKGKIIAATFASNIHRIQQIFDVAKKYDRKVFVTGFSLEKNIEIAKQLGYINFERNFFHPLEDLKKFPPSKVVCIVTGTQGEPMSVLTRMAENRHKQIKVEKGDLVLLASSVIPGNEHLVFKNINKLYELGATVVQSESDDIHVSGHAYTEEQKIMIHLTRPKYFVPIHGEYRHLSIHASTAQTVGIPSENIFLLKNGDILEVEDQNIHVSGNIEPENIFIDGKGIGDISDIVIEERQKLAEDGTVAVVVTLTKEAALASPIEVISRGFVLIDNSEHLLEKAKDISNQVVNRWIIDGSNSWDDLKKRIKRELKKYFNEEIARDPFILVIIVEV
ncbi:MAG: ribonuclease J [Spirochaetales bacterium]|jgi:ribonuclease J|nr:ribonuclease J [Exilispira sp.]NMC66643.1 ribonuclease J [Spirochaetales bacterium]